MITQARLKELFDYFDGHFIVKKTGLVKKETPITKNHRYARIVVDNKAYYLHRLIYLFHVGSLPKVLDHVDNDRTNNRIENLREATQQQNCLNRTRHRNNASGCKNVHWNKAVKKWTVGLSVNRVRKTFGHFEDLEFAALVAEEARCKFHGDFART
jgi:hypothetical protein